MPSVLLSASLGLSMIFLGGFRMLGTEIPPDFMIGFSLAAMFFSIADLIQFFSETDEKQVMQTIEKTAQLGVEGGSVPSKNEERVVENLYMMLNMGAVFCMIVLPLSGQLKRIPEYWYKALGESSTLIGLGIVITLIGLKAAFHIGHERRVLKAENKQLREKLSEYEKQLPYQG